MEIHIARYHWVFVLLVALLWTNCDRLSVKESFEGVRYELTDHRNESVILPDSFEGKILLVGYVYTHCPDVCPMITQKMRAVERKLEEDEVHFVSITFDPDRDTPEILANYAHNFDLNEERWTLLTGQREVVDSLLERLGIQTVKTPTRFSDQGEASYFIDHTDRVSLIDKKGRVRRHYPGSQLDPDTVLRDIRKLGLNQ